MNDNVQLVLWIIGSALSWGATNVLFWIPRKSILHPWNWRVLIGRASYTKWNDNRIMHIRLERERKSRGGTKGRL